MHEVVYTKPWTKTDVVPAIDDNYPSIYPHCRRITGRAGSQGPWISLQISPLVIGAQRKKERAKYFLYFCNPISHHPQPPIPPTTPTTQTTAHPHPTTAPSPPAAPNTSTTVSRTCRFHETCLRYRRNTGNKPKTWMLNKISENTCVVSGRRDARTTEDVMAAFVGRDAGNL